MKLPDNVVEDPALRGRPRVFAQRRDAGSLLAGLMSERAWEDAIVLAIPAGGVPVGSEIARRLGLALDVAVVSKITLPWNSEAGYGAVAFDGTVRLNRQLIGTLGLSEEEIRAGIDATRAKILRRVAAFRGERPLPELRGRPVVVVDDGIASGFTLRVALEALRRGGAEAMTVAVPTGHRRSIVAIAPEVERLYCANVRGGMSFAVADAYRNWRDIDEAEALRLLS